MSDAERMAAQLRQKIIDDAPAMHAEIVALRAERDALRAALVHVLNVGELEPGCPECDEANVLAHPLAKEKA